MKVMVLRMQAVVRLRVLLVVQSVLLVYCSLWAVVVCFTQSLSVLGLLQLLARHHHHQQQARLETAHVIQQQQLQQMLLKKK